MYGICSERIRVVSNQALNLFTAFSLLLCQRQHLQLRWTLFVTACGNVCSMLDCSCFCCFVVGLMEASQGPLVFTCRYTAVAMPLLYNTRYSSRRRVAVMIAVVWFLSFAISCPLLFGLNNTGKPSGP